MCRHAALRHRFDRVMAPNTTMFSFGSFSQKDMALCSAALRHLGQSAASIEEAAQRITAYWFTHFVIDGTTDPACVLVRLFKTHPYGRLSQALRTVVDRQLDAPPPPELACLTLLASSGIMPDWNDPARSARYRVIPLVGAHAQDTAPMLSRIVAHCRPQTVLAPPDTAPPLLDPFATDYNTWYVPDARQSPDVPAQEDFVVPFGVRSVIGFGGRLDTGDVFAAVLFTKVPIPAECADRFKTFALSVKLALAPFDHPQLTLPSTAQPGNHSTDTFAALQDRIRTLESLLAIQETALAQRSAQLETSLAEAEALESTLHSQSLQYETLSATSPSGIFQADADGRFLYTNPTWQTICGRPLAETLGEQWIDAIDPADRETVRAAWRAAIRHGQSVTCDCRIRRPDGTMRSVHLRAQPLQDNTGQIVGYVGTADDITEQCAAEAARLEQAARLRAIVDHAVDGIITIDDHGRIESFNPAAERIFGYTAEDVIGRNVAMLMPEPFHSEHDGHLARYRETGQARIIGIGREVMGRRKDGSTFPADLAVSSMFMGDRLMFTGMIRDITDRKQAELALRKNRERYRTLIEGVADHALLILNEEGRIATWNNGAHRLDGYEPSDILGQPFSRLFTPEAQAQDKPDHLLREAILHTQAEDEGWRVRKDGSRYWASTVITALRNEAGHLHGFSSITRDITARKHAETLRQEQATRLHAIVHSAADGIITMDAQGAIETFNPAAERMFGYTAAEVLGQNVTVLMPEPHRSEHDGYLARYRHTGIPRVIGTTRELTARRKDGSTFPFEIAVSELRVGERTLFMALARDITDRKQAEHTRLTLQQAVALAQDGIAVLTADGQFTYMNPSYAAMHGYTMEELVGRTWRTLFTPEWAAMLEQLYFPDLLQHGYWQGELIAEHKSGRTFDIEVAMTLLTDPDSGTRRILSTCRDVSTRKRMERDLIASRDAAEAGARAKSEFLAKMSHEIRTPMNGVLGMTSLLLDTDMTPTQRDFVETLKHSGESLLTIINDILDFSKIEAGKLELAPIPFDLRAMFDHVLDLYAAPAQQKQLGLHVLVHTDVPDTVIGDPGRIKQVLNNLVNNAIKFTETGEITLIVSALAAPPGQALVRMEVRDTGIGIPPEALTRLFQSFSQADSSMSRRFGGTGLGLAICKQLVELMNGHIHVESTPGQGSRFWIDLPLPIAPESALEAAPISELAGKRLGIVTSHALSQQVLCQYAANAGMAVWLAESGKDPLAQLQTERQSGLPLDGLVVDVQLAGTTGLALTAAIKQDPRLHDIPVVVLTSMGERGDGKAAQEAGAAAYLTKPIRERQFADCLRLIFGQPHEPHEHPPLITRHTLSQQDRRSAPSVLVVDDNAVNRKVAARMLEKLGCRVAVATNGHEALANLAGGEYALVFMDCQMPEMDGFEATKCIRQLEAPTARHLPIIAMTANAMDSDREQCLASGMDDFMSKPIDGTTLTRMLTRWLPDTNTETEPIHPPTPQAAA